MRALAEAGAAELPASLKAVLEGFRGGKAVSLARAMSVVEDERRGFQSLLHILLADGPQAARVGFTGPPGAGKSTLVAASALVYRSREERVGVVAVDPTSPYSGGALLGDRIRMNDLATDPGIFIRSMATRGSLGGLAVTTKEVIDLMDVFGFERVLVETVGVGQTELEITAATDTVVVVLTPESGDAIQAMKAGLMEIADVFVVNKADRPGASGLLREIRQAIHLRAGDALSDVPAHHGVDLSRVRKRGRAPEVPTPSEGDERWQIPVIGTVAQSGQGMDELLDAVDRHRSWLTGSGTLAERRRARARRRVHEVVERALRRVAWSSETVAALLERGLDGIQDGTATPYSVSAEILQELLPGGD
jgi:LAO/AO transport system kinase